jgi:hypothetical protein
MEAKNIRIGNLTKGGEVKTFWERGVHVGLGKCLEFCDLEPLPLTEDLLNKWGFTCHWDDDHDNHIFSKVTDKSDFILDCSWINQTEFEKLCAVEYEYQLDVRVDYAHELQNLFFALTGTELEYTD